MVRSRMFVGHWHRALLVTGYLLLVTVLGCRVSLSPVKNRIGVGAESYVFFDAAGEGGQGDLFAGAASGGKVFRVTFTRVHESSPALSPHGVMLAFIRGPLESDSAGHRVWVMNLLNGSEREIELDGDGRPVRVAWAEGGSRLVIATEAGVYQAPAPPASAPATPVPPADRAAADTLLAVPLGDPVRALAVACDSGGGICAMTPAGSRRLAAEGRAAFRWGADSVGYFVTDGIDIRPLSGGTVRSLRWTGLPAGPRTATHFPGAAGEVTVPGLRP